MVKQQKSIHAFFGGKPKTPPEDKKDPPSGKQKQTPKPSDKGTPSRAQKRTKEGSPAQRRSGSQRTASQRSPNTTAKTSTPKQQTQKPAKGSGVRGAGSGRQGRVAAARGSKKRARIESDEDSDEPYVIEDDDDVQIMSDDDMDDDDVIDLDEDKPTPKPRTRQPPPTLAPKPTPPTTVPKPSPPKPTATPQAKRPKLPTSAPPTKSPSAQKAIKAVDECLKSLPDESSLKFSKMEKPPGGGGFGGGGNENEQPPNHGNKPAPVGHPDCLSGKIFVVSGVLDSLFRDQAEALIKRHGGTVTKSVSGRTTCLLVGEQCGASKYGEAKKRGTKLIDEDGLFQMIRSSEQFVEGKGAGGGMDVEGGGTGGGGGKAQVAQKAQPVVQKSGKAGAAGGIGGQLWVDKYKPQCSEDLVGNNQSIALLKQWLLSWQGGGKGPIVGGSTSARGKQLNMGKKAVLLSGPPGIGKTSSAHIIARECGYDVIEVNASDTRQQSDKSALKGIGGKASNTIRELVTNRSLRVGGGENGAPVYAKQVLVMDEVDGMSGNADRGGVADLIATIARSHMPIICVCNDKYHQKLRSLKNHCLELDFRRPTKLQLSKRLFSICSAEGLTLNEATMDEVINRAEGDMRCILGYLMNQALRRKSLSYDDVTGKYANDKLKDIDMSPFAIIQKLLEKQTERQTVADYIDYAFMDDLVPPMVQENYLNYVPSVAGDKATQLKVISKASKSLCEGDVFNNAIYRGGHWSIMPAMQAIGVAMPAAYMKGRRIQLAPNDPFWPRFPAALGNLSSTNKNKRMLIDIAGRLTSSGLCMAGGTQVRSEYIPTLRSMLTAILKQHDKVEQDDVISQITDLLGHYCLGKDEYDFVFDVTTYKKSAHKADVRDQLPTKMKSALTRQINTTKGISRSSIGAEAFIKKGSKGGAKGQGKKGRASGVTVKEESDGMVKEEEQLGVKEESEEEFDDEKQADLIRKLEKRGMSLQGKAGSSSKSSGRASGRGGGASGRGKGRSGRGSGKKGK